MGILEDGLNPAREEEPEAVGSILVLIGEEHQREARDDLPTSMGAPRREGRRPRLGVRSPYAVKY